MIDCVVPKTFAAIVAVALLSSLLVLMRWPTDASIDLVNQGARQVFRPVAFALAAAVMMLIPAFPATAFVTERRRGTLTLLLNSPTTPVQIYLGKLCGNVLLSLVILSVSLPALAACFAMGGISLTNQIGPLILDTCWGWQFNILLLDCGSVFARIRPMQVRNGPTPWCWLWLSSRLAQRFLLANSAGSNRLSHIG